MEFKKAVKTKQRLRLAVDGVSGSGKTFTALAIAAGMGGPVALIDSEHGSASLYADRFEFDTLELISFQIEDYIEALDTAAAAQYAVVIIDSTSHGWDALVERVERIAYQKFSGNTFRAWGEGTPLQKKLIEAMLNYPGHIIVTCRSKTEYSVDKNDKDKTTVTKVGTAAVQRQGFEYEFTMAMTMDTNHVGLVTKDRTGKFQDRFIEKPGKELGQQLIAWLGEGKEPPPPPQKTVEQQFRKAIAAIANILTGTADNGERYFTDEEAEKVKAKVNAFPKDPADKRLEFIKKLLGEYKVLLQNRIELSESVSGEGESCPLAGDAALTAAPSAASAKTAKNVTCGGATSTANTSVPAMYDEPEDETPAAGSGAGDGFEDDIPWDKEPPKGKGQRSLKDEFHRSLQEKRAAMDAEEAAQVEAYTEPDNPELDIF